MDLEFKSVADAMLGFVRAHQSWTAPIVFTLAFGESLAFVSLILPFWGILVGIGTLTGAAGTLDFWIILLAAAIGAALGDWLSYWLGWHYHAQIARMWPLRNYPELLPRGEHFFKRYGAWAIVLGRFSGPLRASIPIVAGAVRMPNWLFQLANWPSAFLWAAVLLIFGADIGKLFAWVTK